jgi:hypothetical protein
MEKNVSVITNIDIVPVNENFRGLSYGQWAAIWDNWLMSEDPDNSARKDILFLRGNIDYRPVASVNGLPRFLDRRSTFTRTGENAEMIFDSTAILIPVLTARYSIGDIYDGRKIKDEYELRGAVNRDTDESLAIWATIMHDKKTSKIADDLNTYRIESPLFKLSISHKSKLRLRTQDPSEPGIYDSVVGGFFLIIRSFAEGNYRIQFGGRGRGNYSTNSIYDIAVRGKRKDVVKDSTMQIISNRS